MKLSRSAVSEVFNGLLPWRYKFNAKDIVAVHAAIELCNLSYKPGIQAVGSDPTTGETFVWLSPSGNLTQPQFDLLSRYGTLVSLDGA